MAAQTSNRMQFFANSRARLLPAAGFDVMLLLIVGALVIIGLLIIYSVSFGPNLYNERDDPLITVEKQILALILGSGALVGLARLDYHRLQRYAVPLMLASLASLVLVLFVGTEVQGAKRWLWNNSFQPGEVAKLITVIYIATWVTSKGAKLRQILYGLVPFSILVGLVAGLIVLEPNYSTALLIAATAFAMFFVAGADALQFALSMIIGGLTAIGLVTQSPRALERFGLMWADPFKVTSDQTWQLAQTLIALASGGLFGKGLGTGGGQYGYVPLAHSDGIFAIWGEETGLVGTWLVVGLILALAWRGFRIAANAQDDFGRVLAAGVTFWLTFQAFVNIGVVTQLLPFTGQPLPFISAGGSALVTALAGVGLLLSVSRRQGQPPVKSPTRVGAPPRAAEKEKHASVDYGWRHRGTRLPSVSRAPKSRRRRPRVEPQE